MSGQNTTDNSQQAIPAELNDEEEWDEYQRMKYMVKMGVFANMICFSVVGLCIGIIIGKFVL